MRPMSTRANMCYEVQDSDVMTKADDGDSGKGGGNKAGQTGGGDEKEEEDEVDFRQLLKSWKLDKYADVMEEEGWEDPIDWKDLTDEDLKTDMSFSKGMFGFCFRLFGVKYCGVLLKNNPNRKYKEWRGSRCQISNTYAFTKTLVCP